VWFGGIHEELHIMSKIMLNYIMLLLFQHNISSTLIIDYSSKNNHKVLITMMAGEPWTFSINKAGRAKYIPS
jgi:hypothetical protein